MLMLHEDIFTWGDPLDLGQGHIVEKCFRIKLVYMKQTEDFLTL